MVKLEPHLDRIVREGGFGQNIVVPNDSLTEEGMRIANEQALDRGVEYNTITDGDETFTIGTGVN